MKPRDPFLLVQRFETPDHVRVCLVLGPELRLQGSAEGADLEAAYRALQAKVGRRLPKQAWVVSDQTFVANLELPPRDTLPAERIAGLVRYELEPLVHASGELRFAAGDQPGAALLGAALPEQAWSDAQQELSGCGLALAGVLPGLGAGLAFSEAPGQLLEVGGEGLAFAQLDAAGQLVRWEGGASLTREDVLTLLDPDLPLTVLAASAEEAAPFQPDRVLTPPEGLSVAAWAGAQRALGLPGGERIPTFLGARPSLAERLRPLAPVICVALFAFALGVSELVLQTRANRLTRDLTQARVRAEGLRRARSQQAALAASLERRRADLARLERQVAALDAADQRSAGLALVLSTLATTLPDEVSLEGLQDDAQTLRLTGFSLDSAAVQRLSRDLCQALDPAGLQPLPARVRATLREGVPGYQFVLELRRVPVPRPANTSSAHQAGAQVAGQRPLRVAQGQVAGGSR
jgi:Tfp pilus assembly protein PilN